MVTKEVGSSSGRECDLANLCTGRVPGGPVLAPSAKKGDSRMELKSAGHGHSGQDQGLEGVNLQQGRDENLSSAGHGQPLLSRFKPCRGGRSFSGEDKVENVCQCV